MGVTLPDPKVVVSSVIGGAVELAEGPVRVAENVANLAGTFATDARGNLDAVKSRMPDDPLVIPEVVVKAAGQTLQTGMGLFEAFGKGITDTVSAVRGQIKRVTG